MVSIIFIVGVGADVNANFCHRVAEKRIRTLLNALFGCVVAICIVTHGCLRAVWAASDALLIL
jgi:hypothetical protein